MEIVDGQVAHTKCICNISNNEMCKFVSPVSGPVSGFEHLAFVL